MGAGQWTIRRQAPCPSPPPTALGAGESPLEKVAELGLGITEGEIELAAGIAEDLVLNALTFGGYGTYKLGTALWAGYKEDGVLGALNAVNPLFHIGMGGIATCGIRTSWRRRRDSATPARRSWEPSPLIIVASGRSGSSGSSRRSS
ncbi:MAG: hypothetical protein IT372_03865 [Polyangiaceae bacterium]|nr:hypothetical protein [Polyangiaceae bacterium]